MRLHGPGSPATRGLSPAQLVRVNEIIGTPRKRDASGLFLYRFPTTIDPPLYLSVRRRAPGGAVIWENVVTEDGVTI